MTRCPYCLETLASTPARCPHCDEVIDDSQAGPPEYSLAAYQRASDLHEARKRSRLALAYGLVALLPICCMPLVLGPAAISHGCVALDKGRRHGVPTNAAAIAGIVLGVLATLGWGGYFLWMFMKIAG